MDRTSSPAETRALERIKLELANRHVLVLVHGLLLLEVGIVMVLTGAPDFVYQWFGADGRLFLGGAAIAPAAILLLGAWLRDENRRGYYLQVAGLAGVVLWQAAMAFLYGVYAYSSDVNVLAIGEAPPTGSARLYVPLIYTNILALAAVHLITLIRLGRPPR